MIMKGIFTYDRWGKLQRFVGKLVERFFPPLPKNPAVFFFAQVEVPEVPVEATPPPEGYPADPAAPEAEAMDPR